MTAGAKRAPWWRGSGTKLIAAGLLSAIAGIIWRDTSYVPSVAAAASLMVTTSGIIIREMRS